MDICIHNSNSSQPRYYAIEQLAVDDTQKGDLFSVYPVQSAKVTATKPIEWKPEPLQLLDSDSLRKGICLQRLKITRDVFES